MSKNNKNFRKELEFQLGQFSLFLEEKLKPRTIHRHEVVIVNLIDFLCVDCDVSEYTQIQRGMVCSKFCNWYCSNMADLTESQVNTSVKKFFSFLIHEQDIPIGDDVLKGLKINAISDKN